MKISISKNLRILILVKSIDGGTGTFVLSLLKKKYQIGGGKTSMNILALERPSFRIPKQRIDYFATEEFYPEKYSLHTIYFKNFIRELWWVREKIVKFRPDIVISIDSHCILLSEINKLLFFPKIKTLATIHNHLSEILQVKSSHYLHKVLIFVLRIFLNRSDAVVCTSKWLSHDVHTFFKLARKPQTIYYGLPEKKTVKKAKTPNEKNVIISVARLVEQKDHVTLLRAFSLVHNKYPKSKLWLVGDGSLKGTLKDLAKQLGIAEAVEFFGWVQKPSSLVKKADIFVLASKREGFGYVLIEAMAQGLPVVTTDSDFGPAEIVDEGKYGLLVPTQNPRLLAESLEILLKSRQLYKQYAMRSLERANYFSLKKMLEDYRYLLNQLLTPKPQKFFPTRKLYGESS